MIGSTKAYKRLGIVGAAAVVGLVPISMVAAPAFAASGATLLLGSTAAGATTTATNSFTTTNAAGTGQIVITANSSTATGETLPACISNGAIAPAVPACTNYTVTYTAPGGAATNDPVVVATTTPAPGAAVGPNNTATLGLTNAIPTGSAVTVTINGVINGSKGDVVSFTDTDNGAGGAPAGTPATTNSLTLSAAVPVPTPGVSSINPTALNGTTGTPFTITGTNFQPGAATAPGLGANQPVVCFVPVGTASPAPTTGAPSAGGPCVAPSVAAGNGPAAAPGSLSSVTTTQIQGTSPALAAGNYNVVVYNYDPNITTGGVVTGGYTPASGTTSQTLVGVSTTLNFVPESGVRIVDSRSGLNLPKATLPVGTPVGIPLVAFASSPTLPTNLPGAYTGLNLNVTAVAPASGGNIQMWTAASCSNGIVSGKAVEPATVNFQSPQDTNNSQVIPVTGAVGATQLCMQDNGAAVNVVVDLTGYTTGATYLAPAAATRLLDSRTGQGGLLGPLSSGTVYRLQTGLPTGTQVALNVADVAPTSQGYATVFPEPTTGAPTAANVPNTAVTNFIQNTDSSAMVVTTVGATPAGAPGGYIDIYSGGTGTYNLVIDELGTFAGSSLKTVAQPFRIYDSRPGPISAGSSVTVVGAPSGSGANFVPTGALGLMGNLSDINPVGQGYVVTYPAGGVVPGTASIAHFPAQTRNVNNVVALNPSNGSFSIFASGAATNTTYDVNAYIS